MQAGSLVSDIVLQRGWELLCDLRHNARRRRKEGRVGASACLALFSGFVWRLMASGRNLAQTLPCKGMIVTSAAPPAGVVVAILDR